MTTWQSLRLLAALLGLVGLVAGCVRLSEPERFVCNSDADCAGDQRCPYVGGYCVAKDSCEFGCDVGQHCENSRCVTDDCAPATEGSDCNGFRCAFGVCDTFCASASDCAINFHCDTGSCLPGAPRPNGSACTTDGECSTQKCCVTQMGKSCADRCPAAPNETCTTGPDCVSGNCCRIPQGMLVCSTVPCSEVPECLKNLDCDLYQVCMNQKCVTPPEPKGTGEACAASTECESASCVAGFCRGTAKQGDSCTLDVDCEGGRICCESTSDFFDDKTCGELNRGCPGSIGAVCDYDSDCLSDNCIADFTGFCSKSCTTNAECGTSPWGVPNACETNGLGQKICFPGCTTSFQCQSELDTDFDCYDALDSNAKICAGG